ncbi:RagB/SusD family nutrient uptake outer membrane protein [Algibacter sp. AS12]|uniref:RagB/SusD family nutrient uptake outer membrane protein n=1 Tax=Algibacter sp. AS12 TaxID=3135773 RepID=UPI00398B33ED
MKTKIKYYITSMALVLTMSCSDYIDVVPDNVATFDLVFNNRVNAKQFFYTLYGYLPHFANKNSNIGLISGDEAWTHWTNWPGQNISQGLQNVTSPLFNQWGGEPHVALRDCNIFINRLHEVRDMTDEEKTRWIAEAKFLKAYFHFHLLRMYGPIPIIDENIEVSESVLDVRIERDSVDDVVSYITSVLDESIADLPSEIVADAEELGRATKPIAAMLKAKVLAYAASPLFNGNSIYATWTNIAGEPYINQTYDANKWQLAADACKEAIDLAHDGGHSLYEFTTGFSLSEETKTKMNLREAITDDWNVETIWGQRNPTTSGIQYDAFVRVDPNFVGITAGQVGSFYEVPLHIAEMFYSKNGVPINEDNSYNYANRYELTVGDEANKFYVKEGYQTVGLHLNREPRFYASVAGDGILSYDKNNESDDTALYHVDSKAGGVSGANTEGKFNRTGYWAKKLINWESVLTYDNFPAIQYTWPVYRLSDLYLLYAECLNEAAGPSSEVFTYLDLVRERSGLDGVEASWAAYSTNPSKPSSKDGLREIIHQERLIELAFEGHRFWDLRRWFKAHLMLNDLSIKGWDMTKSNPDVYYNQVEYGIAKFSIKDYFWPISEYDILRNPNLNQAFGW